MSTSGIRKAASLLMDLPPATAAELLKSAPPSTIPRIAAEVAYLQKIGVVRGAATQTVREFAILIGKSASRKPVQESLAQQILEEALGPAKAQDAMKQVQEMLLARDPFEPLRDLPIASLVKALEGEAPQVVTMLLNELPPAKSSQLLSALPEATRMGAIQTMAAGQRASTEVKLKVAMVVMARLRPKQQPAESSALAPAPVEEEPQEQEAAAEDHLRKVALVLRVLEKEQRDAMLGAIASQSEETGQTVKTLMVVWDDLPIIPDRALQQVLRKVDTRKLALALVKADPAISAKFRTNMSERAGAMLDEETSLLNSPKPADIEQSRTMILTPLIEMLDNNELNFAEAAT